MVAWNLCVPSPQRRPAGAAHAARYPPTGWRKQKVAFTFRLTTPLVKLADLRAKHAGHEICPERPFDPCLLRRQFTRCSKPPAAIGIAQH